MATTKKKLVPVKGNKGAGWRFHKKEDGGCEWSTPGLGSTVCGHCDKPFPPKAGGSNGFSTAHKNKALLLLVEYKGDYDMAIQAVRGSAQLFAFVKAVKGTEKAVKCLEELKAAKG